jgi:Protein kinase domain
LSKANLALLVLPTVGYFLVMRSQLDSFYGVDYISRSSSSSSSSAAGASADLLVLLSGGADRPFPSLEARGLAAPPAVANLRASRGVVPTQVALPDPDAASATYYQMGRHLLPPMTSSRRFRPNYAYLEMDWLNATSFRRTIHRDDAKHYHMSRYQQFRKIDREADARDFSKKNPDRYVPFDDIDYPKPSGCYRPKWTYEIHPNCNSFHEQTLERPVESTGLEPTYLGRGYFRITWLVESLQRLWRGRHEEHVLKLLKLNERREYTHHTFFSIQIEALLMDRTAGSPRTSDIYGYCGTSTAVQRGLPIDDSILPSYDFYHSVDAPPDQPANPKVSVGQKLKLAIQMAEGLAELHGDPQGVIVNDDIQVQQWLLGRDGNVRLNDMNNGKVLQWNPDKGEYCTFSASFDYLWRAPEETNRDAPADESADVYALGQIYYTLLTGLVPLYERGGWTEAIAANRKGRLPHIADQYKNENATLIERRLVELMGKIWQYDRLDRPSIFAVLQHLYETARLYENENPDERKIADVPLFDLVTTPY